MLSVQKQPKFFTKTVTLPDGRIAAVVFELVQLNGKTVAKAVCGKVLHQEVCTKETTLALPAIIEKQNIAPVKSPFFATVAAIVKDLSFIIAQPSRAPDFI
ncbi:MAG: hypothetical protein KGH93_01825 [Patescibacteria group bacterium]|nr:hypothetical protein [Patescibacteria group bacterium]MDE1945916.1 hypothetical protein [Patescibacteria group bacterium]